MSLLAAAAPAPYISTMTIVHAKPPRKRPAKPAQAAEIKVPRIVQHTPKGRAWKVLPPNAEADAKVKAFFERMVQPQKN